MKQVIAFVGMVFLLLGCSKDGTNPVAPALNYSSAEKGSQQASDDTTSSDILSATYPSGAIVIAAIGDSITFGTGAGGGGYPLILERKLQAAGYNVIVNNEGVPGEISAETDERFLNAILNADIALIMIGTNDVINHRGNYSSIAMIERLLDKAIISKTIVIEGTVPPAATDADYAWANSQIEWLNEEIADAVAKRPSAYLVDIYNAIFANGGNSLYVDRLHFNDAGYAVIADQWYNCLINNKILDKVKKK